MGAYGEMQSIDDSLDFYRTSYEDEVSKKELNEHLISLEAWEKYAYNKKMLLEFTVFLQANDQSYNVPGCIVKDFEAFGNDDLCFDLQVYECSQLFDRQCELVPAFWDALPYIQ